MPQVIAWAASAIVSAAGITGTAATIASAALQAVAYAGINAAMAPKVEAAEGRPTEWSADPDAPIPFVFGLRGVAGQIVHRDTFGPDNRYQGIVTVYSGGGPVNGYGSFYVDGTARTFTGETMDGTPTASLYRQTKLGAQPDTVLTSPSLPGSYTLSGWGASHKLSGMACSMITLFQDGNFKRWPTGEPKVIQEVQGVLAWDPRLDSTWPGGAGACRLATPATWVYSTNGAIHALKWALGIEHNGVMVGGIGASVGAIDVTALIDAANVADTNGWTCGAVAYSLDDKFQVYAALLQAAGAIPARRAGMISCISRGAAPASIVTISAADTAGPFEFQAGAPREGRINTAIPRCVSSAHDWGMVDLSPVLSATYVTEDGGATRSRGIDYPYVTDEDQAAQLARYDIADSREGITGTIPLKPYLRDLDPGDCFTITEDGFAMSGQKCLVLSRSYDPASDVVSVTFRSETNAKHAWALSGTGTLPATPTLGYTDPEVVPTPSGSDWSIAAGSGGVPSLVITGAVPSTVTVKGVVVEWKTAAGSVWTTLPESNTDVVRIDIPGLTANTSHNVRIYYRNLYGTLGASLALSATTTGYVQGGGIAVDTVDTPQIATGAVVVAADDLAVGTSVTIPSRGVVSGHVLIHTVNFNVDEATSTFLVTVSFQYVSSNTNDSYIWMKIGQTAPVWATGGGSADMTNADRLWHCIGYSGPATWVFNITGLSVGTNTLEIHAGSSGSGAHTNTADDPYLSAIENKKAG